MRSKNYFIDNLDRAIEEEWIRVWYQPIVRSTNGKICGQEALSRWIDPDGEMFLPEVFIPPLEEAGLICRLDLYVVEQILKRYRLQEELDMRNIQQSVNLSVKDLFECDMPEEIRRRVDEAGMPRSMLAIEIGAKVFGGDFSFVKEQIDRFHELGIKVCLDGYENVGFSTDLFRKISPDRIKFNLNYIRQFESEEPGRIVLSELMKMAIGLGIDIVCEGVETREEEQFLREIGCEKLQGYYFGEPVSFEEIRRHFRHNGRGSERNGLL